MRSSFQLRRQGWGAPESAFGYRAGSARTRSLRPREEEPCSATSAFRRKPRYQPTFAWISVAISSATRACHAGFPWPLHAVTSDHS